MISKVCQIFKQAKIFLQLDVAPQLVVPLLPIIMGTKFPGHPERSQEVETAANPLRETRLRNGYER